MYAIEIPGRGNLQLAHAVFDFNGTLANGGELLPHIGNLLIHLSSLLGCVILTADSFGSVHAATKALPVRIGVVQTGIDKARFIEQLHGGIAAIGNGQNDYDMMNVADLSIVTAGPEGTAAKLFTIADIFVPDIHTAFDLLLHPKKLIATLRA